jgi:enoyl-CoA hydratase/carnithine racemase
MSVEERKYVKVRKADGITWVMLNRPEKRNAMSPELHYEMAEVRVRDRERARDAGIAQFIDDKTFKPTFEPARRCYFESQEGRRS